MPFAIFALALLLQDPAAPSLASRGSLKHASSVSTVAISADSRRAFAGLDDGQLLVWSFGDRQLIAHGFREYSGIRALPVSPDGGILAVATLGGTVHLL